MAMFQQYQNGIQPVTGLSEAGANIGNMYAQGISSLGKGLSEGIKTYNENSAKNDLANAKIHSLSEDVANKIAMYSQDPEIAQSGILNGLMQTATDLQEGPTKGLNQRIALAHEAETRLAGFGQQLQEWSFLRGRQIERGIAEGLDKYAGTIKTTEAVNMDDPNLQVNPNETLVEQKKRVMGFFDKIKKVNPNVQFDDNEFWARWLSKAEQETSKAQGIDPRIISAQLEAITAEKSIISQNKLATESLPEGAFIEDGKIYTPNADGIYDYTGKPMQSSVKNYEAITQKPSEAPARQYKQDVTDALDFLGITPNKQPEINADKIKSYNQELQTINAKIAALKEQQAVQKKREEEGIDKPAGWVNKTGGAIASGFGAVGRGARWIADAYGNLQAKNATEDWFRQANIDTSNMTDAQLVAFMRKQYMENSTIPMQFLTNLSHPFGATLPTQKIPFETGAAIKGKRSATFNKREERAWEVVVSGLDTSRELRPDVISSLEERKKALENNIAIENKSKPLVKAIPIPTPQSEKINPISVGDIVVGSVNTERAVSVSERKAQVQDFLTQRFGAIDPTDQTGKRRIPVQGFEEFFKKAVPESEIKEFTTPSGIRLVHMNGKWEQIKAPEVKSMSEIRKDLVGVYGQQTKDGRLVPSEFIPNSGIYIGGLYRGTDASEAQFNDEMNQLIDARRSIKRLQEINDKTGEWASLKDSGEAIVEVMNLKSALRKDIIGVGTVSNFEQELIDKVIKDPTSFFSMETKDRAILLALAQRVDRRIQNIGAAKGLTVQIKDTNDQSSRFNDLRQRYLREKGLL